MNKQGQVGQMAVLGISAIIILGIFVGGFQLWASFYDFESISGSDGTTGEIDIDEDTLEDIEEEWEELGETIWENYDLDNLYTFVVSFIVVVVFVIIINLIVVKITGA